MRQSDIVTVLKSTGLYVVFGRTKAKKPAPYLRLIASGTNNMNADDRVYQKAREWRVYLVTTDKDIGEEAKLEAAFDDADICWEIADETPVESEALYQVIYEFGELEG